MYKKLSINSLAKSNINRKKFRSYGLIFLVALLASTTFLSTYMINSFGNGMNSLKDRLGADIIIVPEGFEEKLEGTLLKGEPSSFYLEKTVLDAIKDLEGIEKCTMQIYVATLSGKCCSYPIQAIGIDFDTDFVVKPWLEEKISSPLKEREIIIGANVIGQKGESLTFFEQEYIVKEQLNLTGMGFDNTIFMSIEDAREMAQNPMNILTNKDAEDENLISNILISTDGKTPRDVSIKLNKIIKNYDAKSIIATSMISDMSDKLTSLYPYFYVLMFIIWILAFAVLTLIFSISINERRKEFLTLRVIGARKKDLRNLVLKESLIICFIGALIGVSFALMLSIFFNAAISKALDLPFLTPSILNIISIIISSIFISTIIGPLSSIITINKINKEDLAIAIRKNE